MKTMFFTATLIALGFLSALMGVVSVQAGEKCTNCILPSHDAGPSMYTGELVCIPHDMKVSRSLWYKFSGQNGDPLFVDEWPDGWILWDPKVRPKRQMCFGTWRFETAFALEICDRENRTFTIHARKGESLLQAVLRWKAEGGVATF